MDSELDFQGPRGKSFLFSGIRECGRCSKSSSDPAPYLEIQRSLRSSRRAAQTGGRAGGHMGRRAEEERPDGQTGGRVQSQQANAPANPTVRIR